MSKNVVEDCAGCKKPLKKKYIKALGKKWHVEHFRCAKCSKIINGQIFLQKNGLPYCKSDFLKLFRHRCEKCKEYILTEAVEALGTFWHANCFTCTTCEQPIKPPLYFAKEGKPYCIPDYEENFAPKCRACGEYIFENHLKVLGGLWHCNCFVCKDCKKPIQNKYFLVDKKPVCATCINTNKDKSKMCYQNCCSFDEEHG